MNRGSGLRLALNPGSLGQAAIEREVIESLLSLQPNSASHRLPTGAAMVCPRSWYG